MAIRRIQPVLSRDEEYTRSFPGGGALGDQPAEVEAQAPVHHPPAQAPDHPPAPIEPTLAALTSVEPTPVGPAEVKSAPIEAPIPAAREPRSSTPPPKAREVSRTSGERGVSKTTFSIWVRPLLAQVDRIKGTGLPPRRVLKAAWQRTADRYTLGSSYVEPLSTDRSEGREYGFSTTFRLDSGRLTALLHEHDPLKITPYWTLIRGQVEPLFWQALDEVLAELDEAGRAKQSGNKP